MSEETNVELLSELVEDSIEEAVKKMVELSFMRTLAATGEAVAGTINDQSTRIEAIRFIAEHNVYDTMSAQLFDEASRLAASDPKKPALIAWGQTYRNKAVQLETRFFQQYAQGLDDLGAGIQKAFGVSAAVAGSMISPIVGGAFLRHQLNKKLEEALANGQSAEEAAVIIADESIEHLTVSAAGLAGVVTGFVNTGALTIGSEKRGQIYFPAHQCVA